MTLALRQVHVGDCRELLAKLPDESVNCVVTSPPYWGLRDYGVDRQIGLEETPEEYVAKIVAVFRDVRRVLRADGTLWLNLGDCYAQGGRGGIGEASTLDGGRHNQNESRRAQAAIRGTRSQRLANGRGDHPAILRAKTAGANAALPPGRIGAEGLKPKDLIGIPWRVAFALQADGWWLRSDIVWAKPNPMPESVHDRPTKAHEYVFLLSKSERYHYDAAAIREAGAPESEERYKYLSADGRMNSAGAYHDAHAGVADSGLRGRSRTANPVPPTDGLRNKRSVWTIATEPYGGAHFATFPTRLVEPCILAGCPMGGVVLDPFGGSGTVGQVAEALGRNWILFELNPDYADLARERTAQRGLFVDARAAE